MTTRLAVLDEVPQADPRRRLVAAIFLSLGFASSFGAPSRATFIYTLKPDKPLYTVNEDGSTVEVTYTLSNKGTRDIWVTS